MLSFMCYTDFNSKSYKIDTLICFILDELPIYLDKSSNTSKSWKIKYNYLISKLNLLNSPILLFLLNFRRY